MKKCCKLSCKNCERQYSFVLNGNGTGKKTDSENEVKIIVNKLTSLLAYQVYNNNNKKINKERIVTHLNIEEFVKRFFEKKNFIPTILLEYKNSFQPNYIGKITNAYINKDKKLVLKINSNGFINNSSVKNKVPTGNLENMRMQIDSTNSTVEMTRGKFIYQIQTDNIQGAEQVPIIGSTNEWTKTVKKLTDGMYEVTVSFEYPSNEIPTFGLTFKNIGKNIGLSGPVYRILDFGNIPLDRNGKQFRSTNLYFVDEEGNFTKGAPTIVRGTSLDHCFKRGVIFPPYFFQKWDTSNATSMAYMFFGLNNFNSDISKWNVSNVTNMNSMFRDSPYFNQDLSNWDVSNVTNMNSMFAGATYFTSDIRNWNVSKVTNMFQMFFDALSFNQDISKWDVLNVTNMNYMFFGATQFKKDLSKWCVEKIKSAPTGFSFDTKMTPSDQPKWGQPCNNTNQKNKK